MNRHQKEFTAQVVKELSELFKLIDVPEPVRKMSFRLAQVDAHAYGENGMDVSETADLIIDVARIEVAAGCNHREIAGD